MQIPYIPLPRNMFPPAPQSTSFSRPSTVPPAVPPTTPAIQLLILQPRFQLIMRLLTLLSMLAFLCACRRSRRAPLCVFDLRCGGCGGWRVCAIGGIELWGAEDIEGGVVVVAVVVIGAFGGCHQCGLYWGSWVFFWRFSPLRETVCGDENVPLRFLCSRSYRECTLESAMMVWKSRMTIVGEERGAYVWREGPGGAFPHTPA